MMLNYYLCILSDGTWFWLVPLLVMFITWARWCLLGFSTVNLLPPATPPSMPSYPPSLKLIRTSWRVTLKQCNILFLNKLSVSAYLSISIVFYLLLYTKIHCYHLFWCKKRSIFGQWEHFKADFCVLLTYPHHSWSISLLSGIGRYPGSSYTFLAAVLESVISPWSPVSF